MASLFCLFSLPVLVCSLPVVQKTPLQSNISIALPSTPPLPARRRQTPLPRAWQPQTVMELTDPKYRFILCSMRYLILHADDFGLSPNITDGILEAHTRGLLTSTSLLVGAPDAIRAARLSRSHARLGVGLHLALTQVRPILGPRRIPSLLDPRGRNLASAEDIMQRLTDQSLMLEEVRAEWDAQILAAQNLGLTITHLDGHHHLHLHPQLLPIVLELMQRHAIAAIRLARPDAPQLDAQPGLPPRAQELRNFLRSIPLEETRQAISHAGRLTTDHFIGVEQAGRFNAESLIDALTRLPLGTTELMLHPGRRDHQEETPPLWDYAWEQALEALQAPKLAEQVRENRIELIHFGHLPTLQQYV